MRQTVIFGALIILAISPRLEAQRRGGDDVRANYAKREAMIPMRDGARLFTAIYTPKDTSKPYPIMMSRSPYSTSPYGEKSFRRRLGPSSLFTKSGFIFVYQDVRGKYMSEGDFVPVRPHNPNKKGKQIDESSDTYDTIEWLLKNIPNHNGRVGTWGISAPGFYATHTTIDAHPALKAASPQAPVTDWWLGDDRHHNGALMLQASFSFVSSYGAVRPKPSTRGAPGFRDYGTGDGYQWYLDQGPMTAFNDKHFHEKNPLWNDLMEHEDYDAWWQARTPLPHLNDVKAATLTVGGFFDAQDLYGPLKTFGAYAKRNPRGQHHLVMGPWSHGSWSRGTGDRYEAIWFKEKTGPYYREKIEFPFFAHHLKGAPSPELPVASVFVSGSNQWHTFDQWPPKQVKPAKLYVHADGDVGFNKPKKEGGFREYVSDPDKPVPHTPKKVIRRDDRYVVQDQRFAASRPDVLVFESAPLTEDVSVVGELFAHLYVTTTGTDADFVVKLIDVYPPDAQYEGQNTRGVKMGNFQFMVRGEIMRAKYRNSFEHPEPMKPGEVAKVRFDMQDVAHTFLAGHRIMVQIQSTWFPLANRNPQVFVKQYKASADVYRKATHRVYMSPRHPSHLEMSILKAAGKRGR